MELTSDAWAGLLDGKGRAIRDGLIAVVNASGP
jgi:hypothetical protein